MADNSPRDLLPGHVRDLLERERGLLQRLTQLLERAALPEAARRAADAATALSEAFLLVIVGEFNAGKSSVVNALFGEKLMEEGPIPTTAKITLVRYGTERAERLVSQYLLERRVPSELLKDLTLVDTPGTNSIVAEHQRLTEDFIPRADLVLFVTSYDRPLTATEVEFLGYIRGGWGKHFVCLVNKADLARSDDDLKKVLHHVRSGIEERFGFTPEVFPISAALAFEAKTTSSDVVRATLSRQSRFDVFEYYVRESLSGPERVRIKLAGPLAAARAQLAALDGPLAGRRESLDSAHARVAGLMAHLKATETALGDVWSAPRAVIRQLVEDTRARGVRFLDNAFRVTNLGLLRDKDRFKEEFQRQVIRDLDHDIEKAVEQGVDAMQHQALALWQSALTTFRETLPPNAPGDTGFDRSRVFSELEREADRQLKLHDVREEARAMLEAAQSSASLTRYAGFGGVGLGAMGALLVIGTHADLLGGFGLVTGTILGLGSLTFLPMQKRRAITQYHARMDDLTRDLDSALATQFQRQASMVATRVANLLEPLEKQAQAEADALAGMLAERDTLRAEATAIDSAITQPGA